VEVEAALPLLEECVGISFGELFADLPKDLVTNKGNVGQLLLLKIGLKLDSDLKDFSNGELKTNKSDRLGNPRETMFITQVSQQIDTLVSDKPLPFEESNLFKKIERLIYLPVCKDEEDRRDWFFVSVHDVDLNKHTQLKKTIESDYYSICEQLREHIIESDDGFIHTSNGELIQIRSKDSKRKGAYNPIFSKHFNRFISNKNHAFYFKKEFMNHVRKIDGEATI